MTDFILFYIFVLFFYYSKRLKIERQANEPCRDTLNRNEKAKQKVVSLKVCNKKEWIFSSLNSVTKPFIFVGKKQLSSNEMKTLCVTPWK